MNETSNGHDALQERHEHRSKWAWWVFAVIALFYLLTEHRVHFLGALPYLLLLACPLMHLFMHHDHGHHGQERSEGDKK